MLAGDIWNQQGNGRSFTYDGATTVSISSLIGLTSVECDDLGVDYSIVEFDNANVAAYSGLSIPICCPAGDCPTLAPAAGSGTGTHIGVRIPVNNGAGTPYGWGNGHSGASWDLVAELVHEFGHSMNWAHPASTEASVMDTRVPFSPNHRDLWEYDFKCTLSNVGQRAGSAYKINHETGGAFGTPVKISGTQNVSKAMAGINYISGSPFFATTYHRGSKISFSQNASSSYVDLPGDPVAYNGIGFALGLWRETTTIDHIIFTKWNDTSQYAPGAEHEVGLVYSSNKFSSATSTFLQMCTSMTGWLTCTNKERVRSAGVVSTAWWNGGGTGGTNNRTVMAWANMDRSANGLAAESNEVWITVGSTSQTTLPVPTKTGIKSAVPPAVVCRNNFTSTWDCIVAYVLVTSMTNSVRIRRFSISAGTNSYSLTFDSNVYTPASGIYSSSALSGWYHSNGSFNIAYRRSLTDQQIGVISSTDGATWSNLSTALDDSITAPSAVGVWHTDNRIVYVK